VAIRMEALLGGCQNGFENGWREVVHA